MSRHDGKKLKAVWCIKHKDGWCATKGGRRPDPEAYSDPTRCNYFVILSIGSAKRLPDCQECLEVMK